ncbi:MAG: adenosylcobalamin-dependent ribonucleoside-diphosphate reductase [Phycisphaeraceae bacterium]|nr:adenosylcobalamin-dependent ribonucleoside-diphosphate reductase [Phycisphaeraceae bacterium]
MKVRRKFTTADKDVFQSVTWTKRSSRITNLDGSAVFEMNDAEVPTSWSQLATDIMVSKYFRKAGVPQPPEDGADGETATSGGTGPERSARQVIHRLAGCWRWWAERYGYFDTPQDAQAFYDELCHMMLHQMCAPNSPQWFNTGLHFAYGINGPAQGHYYVDPTTGEVKPSEDAYTHPQPHACFIQSIEDDLVNNGGIMDLWVREARLFKYGSGTGTNFSKLRGEDERLSGGGRSSGLMSFLKIGDRAAGAIKSGGTTRRAAKMVCLDLDHPDIEHFINWKVREEIKVAAMVEGMKAIADRRTSPSDPQTVGETARMLGLKLDYDFNGESYHTVSGQNSNNSVRVPNSFFEAVDDDADWALVRRTDHEVARKVRARDLWNQIGYAAWRCADPGVQFDSTINEWHTCPAGGRINASNPCSEYMFLDNTACNLASLNLLKFYDAPKRCFDVAGFEHAVRLWTIVLEVSVLMAQFPSREIARLSYDYRTLGLGFANLGAMLMQAGIPYDSRRARAVSGCISAILTGRSYATSAEMAAQLGPFPGFYRNREHMLRVMRNHRRAAYGVPRDLDALDKDIQQHTEGLGDYEGLQIKPVPIDEQALEHGEENFGKLDNSDELVAHARHAWDEALAQGEHHGYRNAQTTVIAPTGTIGLLMDCDTTGVEPDFALVKFKKLAGGGYFKIANQSLRPALEALGYDPHQVRAILTYVMGALHTDVPLPDEEGNTDPNANGDATTFTAFLMDNGFGDDDLKKLTDALPTVFELSGAFNARTLGESLVNRLGLADQAQEPGFDLLRALGLTRKQIKALNVMICGTQTVEGAPELKDEHLPVFDCANTCGPLSQRYIAVQGHIRMMAAAQPFISGAISKTINLPNSAAVEDITASYRLSWELGLKANALYRDGCKLSQPLSNKLEVDEEEEDQENVEAGKEEMATEVAQVASDVAAERVVERVVERPLRRRLPDTRQSITHKFNVAGHEGYLTVGLYENGQPGELFITMAKEGSTIGGLMDSLGTAISVALQYGVPVDSLTRKFAHQRFEPAGMTHNREIPFAKSLVDYIFRWLGMQFIPGYREANAPQRSEPSDLTSSVSRPTAAIDKARLVVEKSNGGKSGNGHGDSADKKPEKKKEEPAKIVDRSFVPSSRITLVSDQDDDQLISKGSATGESSRQASVGGETGTLTQAMRQMQDDAPACDVCGTITVRNGTCYKCLNCGNSMGCS